MISEELQNYSNKYLKYKTKYLLLKGGCITNTNIHDILKNKNLESEIEFFCVDGNTNLDNRFIKIGNKSYIKIRIIKEKTFPNKLISENDKKFISNLSVDSDHDFVIIPLLNQTNNEVINGLNPFKLISTYNYYFIIHKQMIECNYVDDIPYYIYQQLQKQTKVCQLSLELDGYTDHFLIDQIFNQRSYIMTWVYFLNTAKLDQRHEIQQEYLTMLLNLI